MQDPRELQFRRRAAAAGVLIADVVRARLAVNLAKAKHAELMNSLKAAGGAPPSADWRH